MKNKLQERFNFRKIIQFKLTILILLINIVTGNAQKTTVQEKHDFKAVNVTVLELVDKLGTNFKYSFYIVDKQIGKVIVSVDLKRATINEILDKAFQGKNIGYSIKGKSVTIATKNNSTKTQTVPQTQKKTKQITGIVLDEDGEPIIGANIFSVDQNMGVVTDFDGRFSFESLAINKVKVSYIGYDPIIINLSENAPNKIYLKQTTKSLDEIVVVGYGSQRKVSVTGSVSSVLTKDILVSSSPTLGSALAGKITGLTAIQGNGQPGVDDAAMYLRGMGTFNGANPLIMVDGVPRDELRVIDPNEVESVSVLKDASATAVFGVRGANGVIMITTKRGKEGKPTLNISSVQSFSSFTRRPTRITSLEYINLRNQAYKNDGYTDTQLPYQPDVIAKFENPLLGLDPSDPEYAQKVAVRKHLYPNHDYYGESLNNFAPQTRINMNVNGGTDKIKYFVNGNYLYQGSSFKHEDPKVLGFNAEYRLNRYGFRSNVDYQVAKNFKAFVNLGSYIERVGMPASVGIFPDWMTMVKHSMLVLASYPSIIPGPTTIEGFGVPAGQTITPSTMGISAFELLGRYGFREQTTSTINTTIGFDWNLDFITKGLSHRAQASLDFFNQSSMQGEQHLPLYDVKMDYEHDTFTYSNRRPTTDYLFLGKGAISSYKTNIQYSINYNRTFNDKHTVGGMVLAQRDNWESWAGDIPFNVLGLASRFTYGYDNRYLFELNMGYNGSEQFAKGKRFGFFPAVSGAWVVSNEKFLKNSEIITSLKFRASYGVVGNDKLGGSRFLYLNDISLSGGGLIGSLSQGKLINEGLLGNENLTWETSKKQNYGVDIQLIKSISLTVDYFKEHRTGILLQRGLIPSIQGVPLQNVPKANLGVVDNEGVELELAYNKSFSKNFSMLLKGNFSYAENKVINVDEPIRDADYAYRYRATGYSIGQQFGIPIDYSNGNGYFNSQQELDDYTSNVAQYEVGKPRVGDFKYVDVNGDKKINEKDQVPIGYSSIPRINYGLTLSTKYKALDLTVFFQGIGQCSNTYGGGLVYESDYIGTYFDYHKKSWTPERYAAGQEITYPALSTKTTSNFIANSFFIMDKSYVRLRNIEIGYTLSGKFMSKIGINNLRLNVNGQNLLTFTDFKMKHIDPELGYQLDYPISKTVSVGLSINFQ